ncbi:hypothetical protein NYQ83_10950 [Afifella sp. JA880]|uniref:hypothetical protein n=1 Tax=Afifella sp. JA880 TaxID=2975280 RepID=UPI0021BB561F|nr:hypothetical protein [Afifella sp. JA880]MCT8267789.1 hypothetical protein [Afifella sp. JA880]
MRRFVFFAVTAALLPSAAFAYVGPGAGLSLLGALWALVAAIGLAISFVVAWPVRKMMRNRRKAGAARQENAAGAAPLASQAATAEPAGVSERTANGAS